MTRSGLAITGCIFLVASTSPAHAYIDPTTGTFFLQIMAAAALGVVFYFRKALASVKRFLGFKSKSPPEADSKEATKPD